MNRAGIVAIALLSSAAQAPASAFLAAPAPASFSHRPSSHVLTLRKKGSMGVLGGKMPVGRRVQPSADELFTMQVAVPIPSEMMRARVESSFPSALRTQIAVPCSITAPEERDEPRGDITHG